MKISTENVSEAMNDGEFNLRWNLWRKALGTDNIDKDPNTLVNQMNSMCWDIGVFKATMASWSKEPYRNSQNLKVTPILFHFTFDNFFKGLCLSLRKITDKGPLINDSGRQDRSVFSLSSLLNDIIEHRTDYTRRRLFLVQKMEYDVELVRQRHLEYSMQFIGRGAFSTPRELDESAIEYEHAQWDMVCKCQRKERTPDDIIDDQYLESINIQITDIHSKVDYLVNKFYAHAATPDSRASAGANSSEISLQTLFDLTTRCGTLVNSISQILSDATYPFLAVAQFDKWENWGIGWKATPEELENTWTEWAEKVERLRPLIENGS
jgi:hypothetical protein